MAMSGWRIGFLIAPEKIINSLASMQDALLNCLNNTAQFAAVFALDNPNINKHFYKIARINQSTNADEALSRRSPGNQVPDWDFRRDLYGA